MPVLYLVEQGSKLSKTGDTLLVTKDDKKLLEVECHRIDTVLVFGNIQITTQALTEMLDHNIEFALLSMDGRLRGQLTPPLPRNILLRIRQYELANDRDYVLKQAKFIVRVKLENCLEVLKQADWNNASDDHHRQRASLEQALAAIDEVKTLDSLNGIEGSAARNYFSALPILLKAEGVSFNGRKRRPPPDPVNALLSFGYTLLGSRIQALLDASGFDPYLGFMHRADYGRPSLALDLLEPYRAPLVDRLMIRLFNLRIIQPADFTLSESQGCRLTPPAMKKFFTVWEKNLQKSQTDSTIKKQIESLARVLKGEQEYPEHYRFKAR